MAATYIRALADEGLGLSEIGGKGQSLARLASAGLPVPNGFHITTAAYVDFIAEHHLEDAIKVAASNHQRSGKPGDRRGGGEPCGPDHRPGDPACDSG